VLNSMANWGTYLGIIYAHAGIHGFLTDELGKMSLEPLLQVGMVVVLNWRIFKQMDSLQDRETGLIKERLNLVLHLDSYNYCLRPSKYG